MGAISDRKDGRSLLAILSDEEPKGKMIEILEYMRSTDKKFFARLLAKATANSTATASLQGKNDFAREVLDNIGRIRVSL